MSMIVVRKMMIMLTMIIRTPPSRGSFRKYRTPPSYTWVGLVMNIIVVRKMMIMLMMKIQDEYDSGEKDDNNVDDEYEDATKQRFLQKIQDASIVHMGWSSVKVMMIVVRKMMIMLTMIIRTPPNRGSCRKYRTPPLYT